MNVLTLTGNLGADCNTNNVGGTAVCNFNVAMKSGFGDKAQTVWVSCALWGKQAESRLPEFLKKGQQVAVSGEMGTREHEGKTYITLRCNSVDLVGSKNDSQPQQQAQAPQQQTAPQPQSFGGNGQGGFQTPAGQQPQQAAPVNDAFSDDIPF